MEAIIERFGEPLVGLAGGVLLGALFGALAQRSRFCMRSAILSVTRGTSQASLALWLLAVGAAIVGVQALIAAGLVQTDGIRMLNSGGSLSGAVIGGLIFGIGMVLTRGCVSRLIVLSASGNLRSIVSLLVFAAAAYATMKGPLGSLRNTAAGLAPLNDSALNLAAVSGAGAVGALASGVALIAVALFVAWHSRLSVGRAAAGLAIGAAVAAAYGFTAAMNAASFDPQPVRGLSFIAPSVNAISAAIGLPGGRIDFDFGLVPGVVAGAFLAALLSRSLKLEWFASSRAALRYVFGAALMGFGGVLAGGCSMGNGVSGWAIYSTAALAALAAMWAGAALTDSLVDRPVNTPRPAADTALTLEHGNAAFKY